ncbi:MAG TPA: hypothetical protein VK029_04425 [Pseudogracilibacillus sp.]|nr:hypothetical protein [Pseudogracilibacillus sp.]
MFTKQSDDLEGGTEKITDRTESGNDGQTTIQLDPFIIVQFSIILLISLFIFIYIVRRQQKNKE